MKEIKQPKRPLLFYYGIVLLIIVLFNLIIMPMIVQSQIKEVDYGPFMTMTEEGDVGQVEIQSNMIIFTNADDSQVYRTGLVDDPNRAERLHEAGVSFSSEIVEETSPLLSFLLYWILPILIFFGLGQAMSKKVMDKAGGGANSMMLRERMRRKKILLKLWTISTIHPNIQILVLPCQKAFYL